MERQRHKSKHDRFGDNAQLKDYREEEQERRLIERYLGAQQVHRDISRQALFAVLVAASERINELLSASLLNSETEFNSVD